jgi:Uma2 family endonuclease
MAINEQLLNKQILSLLGEVVATNVSLEDYMEHYAADFCEWFEGVVIKMSGSLKHNDLIDYLRDLLRFYFGLSTIGRVISQPFALRLPAFPKRRREPDLMILLKTSASELKDTYLDGAPNICIEVVSEESVERDYGVKFHEYERGGVPEYWIFDPLRRETRFYRLNDEGLYILQSLDANGNYRTPALPGFVLHVPTLWSDELPGPAATAQAVAAMLDAES